MLRINNHEITGIYRGLQEITNVYDNLYLVWTKQGLILCCFSNGYWIDEYPWLDDTSWMDNNAL